MGAIAVTASVALTTASRLARLSLRVEALEPLGARLASLGCVGDDAVRRSRRGFMPDSIGSRMRKTRAELEQPRGELVTEGNRHN